MISNFTSPCPPRTTFSLLFSSRIVNLVFYSSSRPSNCEVYLPMLSPAAFSVQSRAVDSVFYSPSRPYNFDFYSLLPFPDPFSDLFSSRIFDLVFYCPSGPYNFTLYLPCLPRTHSVFYSLLESAI
jgi:hypothetical protein